MEFYDYDNLETIDTPCGPVKESFTTDVGFARATLKHITTAHFHEKTVEYYLIVQGTGELRVKLTNEEVKRADLRPGVVVKIEPNEIHQVRNDNELVLEAITYPAWRIEDEHEVEESLF